jgi:hypothetical protein
MTELRIAFGEIPTRAFREPFRDGFYPSVFLGSPCLFVVVVVVVVDDSNMWLCILLSNGWFRVFYGSSDK